MPVKRVRASRPSPRTRGKGRKPAPAAKSATKPKRGAARRGGLPTGICRVEQESTRTYGYVVRVGHRPSPKGWRPRFTAYFGDFSHGGKKPALAAATKWLRTLERTGKPPKKK